MPKVYGPNIVTIIIPYISSSLGLKYSKLYVNNFEY